MNLQMSLPPKLPLGPARSLLVVMLAAILAWPLAAPPLLAEDGTNTIHSPSGFSIQGKNGNVTITKNGQRVSDQKQDPDFVPPKMVGKSRFCDMIGIILRTGPDWSIETSFDRGQDFFLELDVQRESGRIVSKTYTRLTIRNGVLVRARQTEEQFDPQGGAKVRTTVCGHFVDGPCPGLERFMAGPDEVAQCLKSLGPPAGPDPKDLAAACDLDDPQKVSDETLEKFAKVIVKSIDSEKRPLFQINPGAAREVWTDGGVKAIRYAYGKNPDYPQDLLPPNYPTAPKDVVRLLSTWKTWTRLQAVDERGQALPGPARRVVFKNRDGLIIEMAQEMDYSAQPRPRIKSWRVLIHLVPHLTLGEPLDWKQGRMNPTDCGEYKVEIEDVKEGESAMQGEWISRVTPAGPAYEKMAAPNNERSASGH